MAPPRHVRPGDELLARDHNDVVDDLRRLGRLQVGPGLGVRTAADGSILIYLTGPTVSWMSRIRIKAVRRSGQVVTPSGPETPSLITYDFHAMDWGIDVTGAAPYWGRPEVDDECAVWTAQVGDWGWAERVPDDEGGVVIKAFIEEVPARTSCPQQGARDRRGSRAPGVEVGAAEGDRDGATNGR